MISLCTGLGVKGYPDISQTNVGPVIRNALLFPKAKIRETAFQAKNKIIIV